MSEPKVSPHELLTRKCRAGDHAAICFIVGIDRWGNPALRGSCSKCPAESGYISWSPSLGEWETIEASDLRISGTPPEVIPDGR